MIAMPLCINAADYKVDEALAVQTAKKQLALFQKLDLKGFESLLNQAMAINADAKPEWRLMNLVTQRRAKWLLTRTDQLFLRTNPAENKQTE